ncbi:DNA topoisomerase IV, subunit A [Alteracholeplasma palmae J233]|uniref:DNA topoisomerase 4 subunit A n=1 Tax=Alteracholeplasma palmae (strain ATCC 49389 / J233) TaxID=1318466 RepID=U4KRZ8_ALTPJ|nr:DNA topoisomerase IV subunit A [Alteracholeplasma palmae]CCV64586.1 DNA topoisomerase IV, subunit A [Alteracholeplasma palmae J233]
MAVKKSTKLDKKLDSFVAEKVQTIKLEDIISERFGRYSKYIIQERALPDARDGLKPVQRRILYAMQQMGIFSNKSYKKSARIAGEVMGKYHPHGDSSIYDAMVRLSQDFKMRVPLIDMHGNNGSIDGDSAAAMRYTETRLSKEAEALLADIDKRTVNFIPNFDDEELEPTVLPAKFPNLLVNGAMGISAGYATKIPPHNLKEVVKATIALIDEPDMPFSKMARIIKGPDFPTGGIVQGKEGIQSALKTGAGKVIVRAKTMTEEMAKNQDRIVVTEIPYEVNKAELVKSIDTLRVNNSIDDILEIRDETDQEGLRIAIDLRKGANAQFIINYLLKNTDLQVSYNYNMVAIMNHRPVLVGVIPLLKTYIEHQKEVITNRSNFELEKALKRQHIVEGLIKMVSVVDEVIKIIRSSKNKADSKENLCKRFDFTELQAEAIVTLQLYRLSSTDILALEEENRKLDEKIKELNEILTNEKVLLEVIKGELMYYHDTLGTPRLSQIEEEIENIKIDETQLITDEKVVVGITKDGYVKRSSLRSYNASNLPGLKEHDAILYEEEVQTLDTLLLFTNLGNYIFLPVHKIDDQKWGDLGTYVNNIVTISKDEKIIKVYCISNFKVNLNLLLATKQGMMKQVKLEDLEISRYSKPVRVMKLSKDDEVVSVDMNQKNNIVVLSQNGYALRFKTEELPLYGLTASGVKGIALSENDSASVAFYAKDSDEFYFLTNRGHIIKDNVYELPVYSRYRKGIMILERQKTNPHLVMSASRLSKTQTKDNVAIRILSDKTGLLMPLSEVKYTPNKFGKKIIDEKGYYIEVKNSINEELEEPIIVTKKEPIVIKKQEEKAPIVEEVLVKKEKKIRLSRLDLFDDDDL